MKNVDAEIQAFKTRIETEREFCEELYQYATLRLLAAKYAYYVCSNPYLSDYAYDGLEQSWYIMGRALGYLKEDEHTPCVDFDEKHPNAEEAVELAKKLMAKR
jgi:hypothetical protein